MMKLPSVKRALKPLCWMVASECSRMYIRFLEDVIGGGCSVPQSLLRSGASLLGPSNTCYEKIKWSIFFFQWEYWEDFYFIPSLMFHVFWSWYNPAMGSANKLCIAYLKWQFPKNVCVSGWSCCDPCNRNASSKHLLSCVLGIEATLL